MPRKITDSGPYASIPSAATRLDKYYFATDQGKYYYSDGSKWREKIVDLTDIDPDTEARVMCGITPTGGINPIKISDQGALLLSGSISVGNVNASSFTSGALLDKSGGFVVATANTSIQVVAQNANRKYFFFQNISDTDMYLSIGGTASLTSGMLMAKNGGGISCDSFVPTQAITVFCTAAGKNFTAYEG